MVRPEPTFSIVIPLYNKRDTLFRAIDSAVKQTIAPLEVVVVDDGSTDGSADVAVAHVGGPVRLLRQSNRGPAAARNHGAEHCAGDYLIFLDADEELTPSATTEHARCLSGHADVDLSLASFRIIDADGHATEGRLARRVCTDDARFVYLDQFSAASVTGVATGGICIARSLFKRVSGFDESLRCWEITDLLVRASLEASAVGIHRDISVISYPTPQNSQFEREKGTPEYRLRLARTIVRSLERMPLSERPAMAKTALDLVYSLWIAGHLREYQQICASTLPFLASEHRGARLRLISRMPHWLVRLVRATAEYRYRVT
jgi:glycosyltransferase involved in cell wall biosynthesis